MVMRVPALLLWLLQLPGYKYWLFKRINVLQISLATVQCIFIVISFVEIGKIKHFKISTSGICTAQVIEIILR